MSSSFNAQPLKWPETISDATVRAIALSEPLIWPLWTLNGKLNQVPSWGKLVGSSEGVVKFAYCQCLSVSFNSSRVLVTHSAQSFIRAVYHHNPGWSGVQYSSSSELFGEQRSRRLLKKRERSITRELDDTFFFNKIGPGEEQSVESVLWCVEARILTWDKLKSFSPKHELGSECTEAHRSEFWHARSRAKNEPERQSTGAYTYFFFSMTPSFPLSLRNPVRNESICSSSCWCRWWKPYPKDWASQPAHTASFAREKRTHGAVQ